MQDVAERMGMSDNTVTWNIRQGYLRGQFDGYRYLITPAAFREWAELYYEDGAED